MLENAEQKITSVENAKGIAIATRIVKVRIHIYQHTSALIIFSSITFTHFEDNFLLRQSVTKEKVAVKSLDVTVRVEEEILSKKTSASTPIHNHSILIL